MNCSRFRRATGSRLSQRSAGRMPSGDRDHQGPIASRPRAGRAAFSVLPRNFSSAALLFRDDHVSASYPLRGSFALSPPDGLELQFQRVNSMRKSPAFETDDGFARMNLPDLRINYDPIDPDQFDRPVVSFCLETGQDNDELPLHSHKKGQLVVASHGSVMCRVPGGLWIVPRRVPYGYPPAFCTAIASQTTEKSTSSSSIRRRVRFQPPAAHSRYRRSSAS